MLIMCLLDTFHDKNWSKNPQNTHNHPFTHRLKINTIFFKINRLLFNYVFSSYFYATLRFYATEKYDSMTNYCNDPFSVLAVLRRCWLGDNLDSCLKGDLLMRFEVMRYKRTRLVKMWIRWYSQWKLYQTQPSKQSTNFNWKNENLLEF